MKTLLQIDFPYAGPWGAAMSTAMRALAEDIALTPGLLWKIWTEDEQRGEAGGSYLFADRASASAYAELHCARLRGFGISAINARLFDINAELSAINRAPQEVQP